MHLLAASNTSLDEIVEPVDLGQSPGDLLVLSFADTDLAGIAAAWTLDRAVLPSVRLAHLRDLRHPISVDLWIEGVARHAKVILVRLLGGLDWWRYGVERLSSLARERGIALALLPGEDRDDPRLVEASTMPPAELASLLAYFRSGGRENLRALLQRLTRHADVDVSVPCARPLPLLAGYLPAKGAIDLDILSENLAPDRPVVAVIFYRALLLAGDTAAIDALCEALSARGLSPAPLVVPSLKEASAAAFVRAAFERLTPSVIITTTAFAIAGDENELSGEAPVLQAVIANTRRAAWQASPRGIGAADLAMHVVLPELDGRVLAGAVAFKDAQPAQDELGFSPLVNKPEPDRIAMVAERVAALVRLQKTRREERRVAILMPDYPGAAGRAGYAVGLDVPASVLACLADLRAVGYPVEHVPPTDRVLLGMLDAGSQDAVLSLSDYERWLAQAPSDVVARMHAAWGKPADDPELRDGAFRFRACTFGNIVVALPPDRGRAQERRADYHDGSLPPRHALVAFGFWLRHVCDIHALVHMGAHGTLEWLPGKAAALTSSCFPELLVGALPVLYPFLVSNPGEAAQAKRRIAAVTIGHLPPPLAQAGLSGAAADLERLVDEYAQADGLDRRRRERLARLILQAAEGADIAREAGLHGDTDPDDALRRIDTWLCDLKELAIKDGLHVYGRTLSVCHSGAPQGEPGIHTHRPGLLDSDSRPSASVGMTDESVVLQCAAAERAALIAGLDGKRIAPGPAGAPARGRQDVLPTGRNLYTADPRMLPTQTAMDLGALAADEVIRLYLQDHGEMPRAIVLDLWGSATLRTGGEEIAQGLALMGCRPTWDHATGRVIGIQVLPLARLGRARVDVTWRISGLFRDLFPAQIALVDAATRAVAAREEADEDNPLAATRRSAGNTVIPIRIFGTAPGAYGAGVEDFFGRENDREAVGRAYLAAASHSYGGEHGTGTEVPGEFAARVKDADLLLHVSDDPARDLLEGGEDAAFVGGFAAAAAMLDNAPDFIMLDVTNPQRPRARQLDAALSRIVRGRAIHPRFIEGMRRHGFRGAAELAETVDRLVSFAEMTRAVPSVLFDLVHDAYLLDAEIREFLLRENPAAARVIMERLEEARRNGLWHPRRNDIDTTPLAREAAL
jgi:cobaltochelatase CobN